MGDVARVPLTRGQFSLIDAGDAPAVAGLYWRALWNRDTRTYYAAAWQGSHRRLILLHRLLLDAPAGVQVDHANHDTLNNRRTNIRLATRSQNARNRRRRADNTSGYVAVTLQGGRWRARVRIDGTDVSLGLFDTPEQAARTRDDWIRAHCPTTEFEVFNFARPGERGIDTMRETA